VITAKKDLSRAAVVKISIAMGLSKTESAYFENLVYFNQATSFTERNFFFQKLNAIHPVTTEASNARNLRKDQYEFYSQWYHVVVRSLIDLYPTITDPQTLAKMINPAVTAKQVQKSIELLLRLGLIERQENDTYKICSKILSTGPDIHNQAVQQFHLTSMELASKALQELPSNKRNFSGLTLGISQEAYEQICQEIDACKNKILVIAENDKKSDSVYQLNFHIFPVSCTAKVKAVTTGIEGNMEAIVK
jgi:uncharacterized protein (TIGR02147 family)